ncbi:hypothetical protein [Solirubrobacter soli]|uniref:hypothetical protein n=1 Tax=Solirubrobacter soli TaxID=363832 RepID=UPI0003F6DA06|nr:hypothetical protein [Solirubrobacter soli]
MARDLIPPPSPAGRPQSPDGTPNLVELPPEPTPLSVQEPAEKSPPPGPSQFRNRFGFLLGALAGVFIAVALVVVILIADGGGTRSSQEGLAANWSRWQPSDTTLEGGAAEIAQKVGAEYTHPDGKQLVQVKGTPIPSTVPITLRPSSGPIVDIEGNTVLYTLNGLGENNSILGGKPSESRLRVIHREALELALYTFRYLPDAESVIAVLPPPPPTTQDATAAALAAATGSSSSSSTPINAVFYRPGDLKPQLQVPLGQTLGAKAPNTDSFSGAESDTVETLTNSNVFKISEGSSGILLDR